MAAKSKKKVLVRLVSTGQNVNGKNTNYSIVIRKNPKKHTEKFSFIKFDPYAVRTDGDKTKRQVGCKVKFVEKKMPSHSKN